MEFVSSGERINFEAWLASLTVKSLKNFQYRTCQAEEFGLPDGVWSHNRNNNSSNSKNSNNSKSNSSRSMNNNKTSDVSMLATPEDAGSRRKRQSSTSDPATESDCDSVGDGADIFASDIGAQQSKRFRYFFVYFIYLSIYLIFKLIYFLKYYPSVDDVTFT